MDAALTLKSQQLAFFAQDELVTIIPNRHMHILHFLNGDFGPFAPDEELDVPLWLALQMKKNRQCKIKAPDWLTVEYLKIVEAEEIARSAAVAASGEAPPAENRLPFYWMEIATAFLDSAASDLINPAEIRRLIESIWMNKTSRMRKNIIKVAQTTGPIASIDFSNEALGAMEINTILPLFVETVDQLKHLEDDAAPPVRAAARRQSGAGRTK